MNYEPNSFDGPRQTGEPLYAGLASQGISGSYAPVRHAEDDDFAQAGLLYRVMKEDERARLVATIAGSLAQVSRADIVSRAIAHFRTADPECGARGGGGQGAARGRRLTARPAASVRTGAQRKQSSW